MSELKQTVTALKNAATPKVMQLIPLLKPPQITLVMQLMSLEKSGAPDDKLLAHAQALKVSLKPEQVETVGKVLGPTGDAALKKLLQIVG